MRKNRLPKKAYSISLVGILTMLCCFPVTAFAAEGPYEEVPSAAGEARAADTQDTDTQAATDGNVISAERLKDQLIEYDELGSLIHANNSDVQNVINGTERKRQEYTEIRDNLGIDKANAKAEKEEAEDEGNMDNYAEYASAETIYGESIKSYNKMLRRLSVSASNQSRISLEQQLTNAAQNLMISYEALGLQEKTLTREAEIYEKQYENAMTQKSAGLATEQDTLTAYNRWRSAEASRNSLEDSKASVYKNLCLILGVDESGSMKIGEITSVSQEYIDGLDTAGDLERAVINQTNSQRRTSASESSEIAKKKRTINEIEEKTKIKMTQIYGELVQAQISCGAAKTGLAGTQLLWNNAQSKYNLGMLSETEYLQEELRYIQKNAEAGAADLDLLQALENYNWTVRGVSDLDI